MVMNFESMINNRAHYTWPYFPNDKDSTKKLSQFYSIDKNRKLSLHSELYMNDNE